MSWLLRFLAWTAVLALPTWLMGDAYHRALATATLGILGIPAGTLRFQPPEIPASHVLGVFAALCLASTRAPLARRLAALVIGLGCMIALELLTGTLAIHWSLATAARGPVPDTVLRLRNYLVSLPAWIGAPGLWLLLLGRWELPAATRRHPRRAGAG